MLLTTTCSHGWNSHDLEIRKHDDAASTRDDTRDVRGVGHGDALVQRKYVRRGEGGHSGGANQQAQIVSRTTVREHSGHDENYEDDES